MGYALDLAVRGGRSVSPNPQVGACVVKNGRLLGAGYHRVFGGDHAEICALREAGKEAEGADLYVTLEPCSTSAKTPPCVDSILAAGVSRVVLGVLDPNPRHAGRALKILEEAGIETVHGIQGDRAARLIEPFSKWIRTGLPFVTLKMAQSLDGKIACFNGRSRWITGPEARRWVHELRKTSDAILVGKNTAKLDNPRLRAELSRSALQETKPWRIVVDPRMELQPGCRIFQGRQITLRAVEKSYLPKCALPKRASGFANILAVKSRRGRIDFKDLLSQLGGLGISKLLVEGGGETAWTLLHEGLVDRICWIVAPKFIGGRSAVSSLEGDGYSNPNTCPSPRTLNCRPLGSDWLFEGSF